MRVLLLVNSTASSVTPRRRAAVRRILSKRHEVEIAQTSRRGHATLLARAAARDRFDVVAVLAGDGTLNEAATGLVHTDTVLAPLPGGSTNVYARMLGYPLHAREAASALVSALEQDRVRRVGVGTANDRPFLFCCGVGFDAAVIRRVERHGRRLKRVASHPLHVAAAFRTFFSTDGRRTHATIDLEHGELITDVRFGLVSKMSPYTFLGRAPLHIARNAGFDTRLSLTAFTRLRAPILIGGAVSSMRSGKFLARCKSIVQLEDLGAMRVRSAAPFPYQVDGDDAGDVDELRVAFVADALSVAGPGV